MAKVGVNNEALLERAIFAYDGTNYRVVKCDTSGNLVAAVLTNQNVQARGYGWINSGWYKNPIIDGISSVFAEQKFNPSLAPGTNLLCSSAVPAGKLLIVTNVSFYYIGTVGTVLVNCYLNHNSVQVPILGVASPVSAQLYSIQGKWVLDEADTIDLYCFNATLNDDMLLGVVGYYIDVNQ
jgi:hypothetical protein